MRLLPLARIAAIACGCYATTEPRVGLTSLREPPIRHRRDTPSPRLTSAIAQEADSAPERRRQEADAHAAEIRQLWFK